MGEIAEDTIYGFCCSVCGVYFEDEHGFPVLCKSCFKDDKGKSSIPKAKFKEIM